LAAYLYDAFGIELSSSGSTTNSLRFGGEVGYWRDLADVMYVRARFLDAIKGRWDSRDPIGFDGGDWNLYRHVGNAPMIKLDPSGHDYASGPGYPGQVIFVGDCPTKCTPWPNGYQIAVLGLEAAITALIAAAVVAAPEDAPILGPFEACLAGAFSALIADVTKDKMNCSGLDGWDLAKDAIPGCIGGLTAVKAKSILNFLNDLKNTIIKWLG
jgi:RHS repeat-associated protein